MCFWGLETAATKRFSLVGSKVRGHENEQPSCARTASSPRACIFLFTLQWCLACRVHVPSSSPCSSHSRVASMHLTPSPAVLPVVARACILLLALQCCLTCQIEN